MPETPLTLARPPSLPSVPTSRATRVTSSAKVDSWSTMVLTVSLSWSISPWTSTVTFLVRSPLSVRSFQMPETPLTLARPPSLPSVPTSRATRVTSPANSDIWSAIRFTDVASRSRSPWSSPCRLARSTRCERSPLATESRIRATAVTGSLTSSSIWLSARTLWPQEPRAGLIETRSDSRPSVLTVSLTRCTSLLNCSHWSKTSLSTRATSLNLVAPRGESRTVKSPSRIR